MPEFAPVYHRLTWPASLLGRDEVDMAAKTSHPYVLEHLPALISDRSVQGSPTQVRSHAIAKLEFGHSPLVETIPMPRAVTGDRPIQYPDLVTRVAYNAIVTMLAAALDPSSRSTKTREAFAAFGTDPETDHYVVISDVAACYEYVVPDLLADEVLLRTDDHAVSQALRQLLAALAVRGRGVPQMMEASDRLVDLYLAMADRVLDRDGLSFARTADDYKIDVKGWVAANATLDLLERALRNLGLTLAADKTKIVASGKRATTTSSSDYSGHDDEDEEYQAVDDDEPYEDVDKEESDPAVEYTVWHQEWKTERAKAVGIRRLPPPPPPGNLAAFDGFSDADDLTVELLSDLVFASPPQLEPVLALVARMASAGVTDPTPIDNLLVALRHIDRGNAWSRLWMLTSLEKLWSLGLPQDSPGSKAVIDLARECLKDTRETVRVEAAWVLARAVRLNVNDLQALHIAASPITEPGLAAVVGYVKARAGMGGMRFEPLRAAIVAKRPLNEAAAAWGKAAVPAPPSVASTPGRGTHLGGRPSPVSTSDKSVQAGPISPTEGVEGTTDTWAPPRSTISEGSRSSTDSSGPSIEPSDGANDVPR